MENVLIFIAGMFLGWFLTPQEVKVIEPKEPYEVLIDFHEKCYFAYHKDYFLMQNISLKVLVEDLAKKVGDYTIITKDDGIAKELEEVLSSNAS